MSMVCNAVQEMEKWLSEDSNNVVMVESNSDHTNCQIICCCFMIFAGIFENVEDSIKLYETIKDP